MLGRGSAEESQVSIVKQLILHIGTGKTGSSSIQSALSGPHDGFSFCYDTNGPRHFLKPGEFAARLLKAGDFDKYIYSNEWSFRADEQTIAALSEELTAHFDVQVVLYFRRQDEFELSRYQQEAKAASGPSASGPVALPTTDNPELDYLAIANRWSKHFSLTVRLYDKATLLNGDVVQDFAAVAGIDAGAAGSTRANQSAGIVKTKLGHLLNEMDRNRIRKHVMAGVPSSPKSMPSRASMQALYAKYETINGQLFDQYLEAGAGFSDDFSKYPEQRQDLWTEDTANSAIRHLLTKIAADPVDSIKDAAVALESRDIALSFELMTIAHKLRPNGPFIREKLAEYEQVLQERAAEASVPQRAA